MRLLVFLILCITFFRLFAETNDSISSQQLNELVVLGDRGWIENGVVNFIPSKSEKNLSNSPATLIKSMHLPFFKEKDGVIVSLSGEIIPIFINGEKADNIDLANFWPKDVKRVQYIENPSDPSYEGVKMAVNFIMSEYEVGGIGRLNLFQKVPNNGYYTASSKLVFRKMTYGVMLAGNYYRDHRSFITGETQYRDIFYEQKYYDLINRAEDNDSFTRDESVRCALNAKYSTDKTRIIHTVSLGWNRNPGSGSHSINVWSENLFKSQTSSDYLLSKSVTPQISGNYFFRLSDRWYLSSLWLYSYAKNKNSSLNLMGDSNPIYNSGVEDVNACKFTLLPSFILSDNWLFQLKTSFNSDWYSTLYEGSANIRQNQCRQAISTAFKVNWIPTQTFSISVDPGVLASFWKIGAESQHSFSPTVNAGVSWNPTRKLSINGNLQYYMRPASASESNPVIIQTSELLWLKGNPYLKNLTSWDTYIHSTYLPKRWLAMSFGVGYVKTYNTIISRYFPASIEAGGLLKEIINAEPSDNIRANVEVRGSFFDDNFSIGISPQWYHTYVRGAYQDTFNHFTLSGSADYTISNFRVELWYEGPYKDLSVSGMEKSWKHDNWNLALTYGSNNFYFNFRIEDLFNNKRESWIHYTSPNYVTKKSYFETGRTFSVNLTYTFGYGKKVDNRIDINGPESVTTSILQTK
ncbi:MAG: outer membrane beta-barrel family protein [Muribaculaceae bacterium]|nr:outer membrane beta-barrel family protein [Muribaculaceae bacterium]